MKGLFLAFVIAAGALSQARAVSFSEWVRTSGVFQKKRSIKTRQTMVAAVRGVESPEEVDPQARDYEGLEKVEASTPAVKNPDAEFPKESQEEVMIGRDVAANVIAQFGLYDGAALAAYVDSVGQAVAAPAPRQDVPYRFAVIKSNTLNAFAAPGGYIFITTGLLKSLKDEAQLAGVLAHEVAHVARMHVMKEIRKARMVNAVIPSYVRTTAEKAGNMKQVTDLAIKMLWKGLSREDELESDRMALDYMKAAGYDPSAFREVLELLRDRAQTPQGLAHDVKFVLSTHPKPQDRILAVSERLKFFMIGGTRRRDPFEGALKVLR